MRKIILAAFALCVIAAAGAAVYLAVLSPQTVQSIHAYVSEAPVEIKALQSGKVAFIAGHGQEVSKGDMLLQIDDKQAEAAKQTAEKELAQLESSLHPYTIRVFNNLANVPEALQELEQELKLTREMQQQAEKQTAESSVTHASTMLTLRKLELKPNRIAEDNAELQKLRAEEKLLAEKLERERSRRDFLTTKVSSAEQRLHWRKSAEADFAKLPESQKLAFSEAKILFSKITQAETEMQKSKVIAPNNGIVIKTLVKPDDEAFFGETCLLLAITGQKALVTAFFTEEDARRIKPGTACTVSFSKPADHELTGTITPHPAPESLGDSSDVPFLITLDAHTAAELAKLQMRQEAVVQLKPEQPEQQ
ncbi:HlyD family secretion protein [Desulfovibrio sp. OttesenSCG-928-C06]|nr:HlyD family secretion protein [Desulfovibrio sp. OttesenSCG-928-C06]